MRGVLLLFDHDGDRENRLDELLTDRGHLVDAVRDAATLSQRLQDREYDVVILAAADAELMDLLALVKREQPHAEVLVSSDAPSVEGAVAAMQSGAFHYLSYPSSLEKLELLVQKAMETRMLAIEVQELREVLRTGRGPAIIGQSPPMQELKKTIGRVGPLECTVLIQGETGTGKELVARSIHAMSPRADRTFLAVNCGALSEELLANELFGHEQGAFTGAVRTKKGLFEAADGGTILLDEIGETPPAMQVQLLRVLQERTILRVGGTQELPVDVRVLAATNRTLIDAVAQGHFRQDLLYRLNVFTMRIPPLRERRDDIPLFVRYFLDRSVQRFKRPVRRVSEAAMRLLMSYPFPGNVRELENVIERAVVLSDGPEIEIKHLPRRITESGGGKLSALECMLGPGGTGVERGEPGRLPSLAQVEDQYVRAVLERCRGNKSEAARILGIDRSSLWRRLKTAEPAESRR